MEWNCKLYIKRNNIKFVEARGFVDWNGSDELREPNPNGILNLLYKNGLSLSGWEVITNEAGKKVIKVSLKGNQTEYTPGSMQEGTTLVIYTKIDVNNNTRNLVKGDCL